MVQIFDKLHNTSPDLKLLVTALAHLDPCDARKSKSITRHAQMMANITRRLGTKKLTKVNTYLGGMGRGYPKVDIIFHKNID